MYGRNEMGLDMDARENKKMYLVLALAGIMAAFFLSFPGTALAEGSEEVAAGTLSGSDSVSVVTDEDTKNDAIVLEQPAVINDEMPDSNQTSIEGSADDDDAPAPASDTAGSESPVDPEDDVIPESSGVTETEETTPEELPGEVAAASTEQPISENESGQEQQEVQKETQAPVSLRRVMRAPAARESYTLDYSLTEGGAWSSSIDPTQFKHTFDKGTLVLLPDEGYVYRLGYHLAGWAASEADATAHSITYQPGDTNFYLNENTVLWTVWDIDTYDVTYSPNREDGAAWAEGTDPSTTAQYQSTVTVVGTPLNSYTYNTNAATTATMTFDHWSTDPYDAGKVYNAGDTLQVNGPVTLYAIWKTSILAQGQVDPNNSNVLYTLYADGTYEMYIDDPAKDTTVNVQFVGMEDSRITHVVTKANGSAKIQPTTLFDWFKDCENLSSFDGSGIDTSKVTAFAGWLEYTKTTCNVPTLSVAGTGSWVTTGLTASGTDEILEMGRVFHDEHGVRPLTGNLDLSGWTMTGDGILTPYRTFTLDSASKLTSITLGDGCRLAGTSFSHEGTGIWLSSNHTWSGSSNDLMNRYQDGTKNYGVTTYVWFAGGPDDPNTHYTYQYDPVSRTVYDVSWEASGTMPSNPNVWWRLVSGTLELGVTDRTQNAEVYEDGGTNGWYGASTPWAALHDYVERVDTNPTSSKGLLYPHYLTRWFQNYSNLTYFNGSGLDTSKTTSFAHLFDGTHKTLTLVGVDGWDTSKVTTFEGALHASSTTATTEGTLDIHNWDMTKASNLSSAFLVSGDDAARMDKLTTLVLGDKVVLTGTGFSRTDNGAWKAVGGLYDGRYLRTAQLVAFYGANGAKYAIGDTTWEWVAGYNGGTFASNANVWWKLDSDSTLELGVYDDGSNGLAEGAVINETYANLPFAKWASDIKAVKTAGTGSVGKVKPTTLDWRLGSAYKQLASFDGSGLDTSKTTTFANLFLGHAADLSVTGVADWNTDKVTSFDSAFSTSGTGAKTIIDTLDLSGWDMIGKSYANALQGAAEGLQHLVLGDRVVLSGTGFAHSDTGAWFATNGAYKGRYLRTAQLAALYGAKGCAHALGVTDWQWFAGYTGGTFASNPNVWWLRDAADNSITIGVYDDGAGLDANGNPLGEDTKVTECGATGTGDAANRGNLPFDAYHATAQIFRSVAQDLTGRTTAKVRPQSLDRWLRYYPNLNSFDGSGIDTQDVTSFWGFLQTDNDGSQVLEITGVADWNTSKVTDMNALFRDGGTHRAIEGTLDISGWDMTKAAWATWPIFNTGNSGETAGSSARNLSAIVLGNGSVLIGTAFSHDGTGWWHAVDGSLKGSVLSNDALCKLYSQGGNTYGKITWQWVIETDESIASLKQAISDNNRSGYMPSNPNVWWTLDAQGNLTLGRTDSSRSGFYTESAGTEPWYAKRAPIKTISADASNGKVLPYSLY